LALRQKTIPASLLRRLPKETLATINDPENSVDFWTMHGVVSKRVDHMSSFDWDQVLDNKGNILSADKQQKKCLTMNVSKIPVNPNDIEVPDQLEVKGKYIFLRGKVTTMQVEIKLLRKFIAC
jgi:hypothetical protein